MRARCGGCRGRVECARRRARGFTGAPRRAAWPPACASPAVACAKRRFCPRASAPHVRARADRVQRRSCEGRVPPGGSGQEAQGEADGWVPCARAGSQAGRAGALWRCWDPREHTACVRSCQNSSVKSESDGTPSRRRGGADSPRCSLAAHSLGRLPLRRQAPSRVAPSARRSSRCCWRRASLQQTRARRRSRRPMARRAAPRCPSAPRSTWARSRRR